MPYLCNCQCKIGKSPNRDLYHDLRVKERYSYERLSQVAREKGEDISPMAFHRHFTKHVKPALEEYVKMNASEAWLRERAREEVNLYHEILSNLVLLREKVEEACRLPLSSSNITALTNLLGEIRKTIVYIAQHKDQLVGIRGEMSEDITLSYLFEIIDELPEDKRQKLKAKLQALVGLT